MSPPMYALARTDTLATSTGHQETARKLALPSTFTSERQASYQPLLERAGNRPPTPLPCGAPCPGPLA
eukprot:CAMPEP_0181206214 /NCGR_PEP_ID=MMETSP1096-20121128/20913_1 /TAXON_ID=156174 ORGANISM="Chrysochromulina ericina, Strain CCMP281" /NCGR_SAMPLE_ID=MMETSP1096 /ASSEMBLY_ACC=CAM_ASM_000453 /LENGTH=67 /DNA_ID=CAMNT_0023297093 /DNA_START=426 /DNA_END=629 /DNA_ORIENTATION=+